MSESTRPDDLNSRSISLNYLIEEAEIPRLSRLCGPLETNIDYLARRLGVGISRRGAQFQVSGQEKPVRTAISVLEKLYAESKRDITHETIHLILQTELEKEPETMSEPRSQLSFEIKPDSEPSAPSLNPSQISQTKNTSSCTKRSVDSRRSSVRAPLSTHFPQLPLASYDEGGHTSKPAGKGEKTISLRRIQIRPRGERQQHYISQIQNSSLVFGVGPAGTGKTFLAVACAVEALESDRVERLILVRPAVEAGERLGFLPGDMAQKVDPYLRPIYDALYHMMGFERVTRLMEKSVIEVAPLAYMRGRTLNNAFVILDEAQNTTRLQMKMFLTRLGFGSTAVVTGDVTQVDLPMRETSGLSDAIRLLTDVKGVGFTFFQRDDVVRHPLVSRIIEAYEDDESE